MEENNHNYTVTGTDIEEVKRKNAESGLSYNEVKALIANTTGGRGTSVYSDTNPQEVRKKINPKQSK
ncbi:gamma-type small acid-soluble spore protein [Oceanobacillus salinisoli]|uniref:gamma-type small acid-soluble spore protein n=1 Tax=Oceanobacillus salinisoli TaxID=2678611 RepID=UPI0012E2D57D|nr:gamma-type small acid-soluble spore protein [Oceanobacillus salinisoli]